jgi:hypothetical protein
MLQLLVTLALVTAAALPHPKVATQAMLLAIADGKLPLADLVDPEAGVAFIDDHGTPREDAPPNPRPRLYCGEALIELVKVWQRAISKELRRDRESGRFECQNRPGPPTCSFGELEDEWSTTTHVIFRVDAERGLRLVALVVDDENAIDRVARHRAQARVIARLTRDGCPAPAPPD